MDKIGWLKFDYGVMVDKFLNLLIFNIAVFSRIWFLLLCLQFIVHEDKICSKKTTTIV